MRKNREISCQKLEAFMSYLIFHEMVSSQLSISDFSQKSAIAKLILSKNFKKERFFFKKNFDHNCFQMIPKTP